MLTGRDTLGEINDTLRVVRHDFSKLDTEMQATSEALTRSHLEQTKLLRTLASERIGQLTRGDITRSLDGADQRVSQLLDERRRVLEQLMRDLDTESTQLHELETQRDHVHDRVEIAAQALADLEAQVQQLLESEPEYAAQLAVAEQAQSIAQESEDKVAQAEADRTQKGAPYVNNKLFSYLWKRKYGTSEYSAGKISSMLDDWVAGLCEFSKARANYWMLLEIPKRLSEHARLVAQRAEAEVTKLEDIETRVAAAAGVPQALAALTAAEAEQDACDAQIDLVEQNIGKLHAAQGQYAVGEDDYTTKCLNIFAEAYEERDIYELNSMVRRTRSDADDQLVRQLGDVREDHKDLLGELDENKQLHAQHAARLKELEDVRRRFKRHRYDDLRSGFSGERMIRMVLNEFLRGAVGASGVWDTLQRHQRYRDVGGAWPDFGSGGLRRGRNPRSNSPWHWPGGRGGFRMPRGGGSRSRGGSRGGFRTGGGF